MKPEKPSAPEKTTRPTRCPWGPSYRYSYDYSYKYQWGHGAGEGQGRDEHHWHRPWGRPPRHWFFMKILFFFFWICVVLTVSFYVFGGLTGNRILHAVGIVFIIMLLGGMVLRRMFSPLRWLMRGVHEISNGNLDFQFPTRGRHGEIWYLADQFNQMVDHVKEMIHSKDQLLLDVSHELRSPLTRLKLALEMSPKGKMKDSMLKDVAEMETMLTEILETERLKNGNGKLSLSPLNLAVLAGEIIKRYKGRKPGIKIMEGPAEVAVSADLARVKTVLQNVLENALKYSSGQNKAVQIGLKQSEKDALITVQDFGPGIPLTEQERIFEPFYRVDKSRTKETGGYGLGLSLCREIMLAHGGDIRLESREGQGTKVTLRFPLKGSSTSPEDN